MAAESKVAIVTGGSRGIGYAIAEALVAEGYRVAVAARSAERLEQAAARLNAGGGGEPRALAVRCDVRRHDEARQLIERTVSELGRLDVLVNNAGIGAFAPVAELSVEEWDDVIGTNLDALFYCTREAIPHLKRSGDAWVINIGSLAGKNFFPGGAAYNASKAGLIGFSEALMQEVRHDGIRVSYILPGSVATEFSGPGRRGEQDWKVQPEDVARIVTDLLRFPARTLPSRVEVRPSRPPKR